MDRKDPAIVGSADIVTNSGRIRPIDAETVGHMKPSAVIPLMYESWEYRAADVDLEACRTRGILVGGTNERHPAVDVFSFLGQMALLQLHEAGIAVRGSRILLLCDNAFAPFIEHDLKAAGADVTRARTLVAEVIPAECDAVLLALQPRRAPDLDADDARLLSLTARRRRARAVLGGRGSGRAERRRRAGLASARARSRAHGRAAVRGRARADRPAPERRAQGGPGAGPRHGRGIP